MSISIKTFRLLLAISVVSGLLSGVVDFIPGSIPEELQAAYDHSLSATWTTRDTVVSIVAVVLIVLVAASTIGLWLFRSWAPRIALLTTFMSIGVYPLVGAMQCLVGLWH